MSTPSLPDVPDVRPALADAEARDRIREDTGATLFVTAGAGAGKTTALVQRILTLVLRDGAEIEQIAAVTFTERAAADLRDKIRIELERAAADPGRRERAERALAALDRAAFGTLHSFAQRILTQHAIAAGIPPALEVVDEIAGAVADERTWQRLRGEMLGGGPRHDSAQGGSPHADEDGWPLFDAALALGMTEAHLRSLVQALGRNHDLIARCVTDPAPRGPLRPPDLAPLHRRAEVLAGTLADCTDGQDTLAVRLTEFQDWAARAPELDAGEAPDLGEAITWLRDRPQAAGSRTGSKTRWTAGTDLPALRTQAADVTESADAVLATVRDEVLRRLLAWLGARLLTEAPERRAGGRLRYQDLLVCTRDLLRTRPEVRESLRRQYRHLMLDEFQDTDPLQIEIATRIAAGADGGAEHWQDITLPEGSLFVVGDPKQSIYRFRRADIALFLQAQGAIGQSVSLTSNFRSTRSLISWVNAVFAEVITPEDGVQSVYEPLSDVRADLPAGSGPAVAVLGADHHVDAAGKAASAPQVRAAEAADIAAAVTRALDEGWQVTERTADGEVLRPLRLGDITLLVPTRTSLTAIEGALDTADIPYRTEASSLVYTDPDVLTLLAAARAIADPTDELALVTALRSPHVACGDDDLWTWRRDGGSFDLRLDPPEGLQGHPVAQAIASLRRLHRRAARLAPSELLGQLIAERRMLEIAAASPRARDTMRRLRFLVEQARAFEDVEHGSLRAFCDFARTQAEQSEQAAESVLPETDTDGLRITTIHASKGLDFPMVIMAGLGTAPRDRGEARILWGQGTCEVAMPSAVGGTCGARDATEAELEAEAAERARLLYVAATRARDHLVVSLHRPGPSAREKETPPPRRMSSARWLVTCGALGHGSIELTSEDSAAGTFAEVPRVPPPPPWEEFTERLARARRRSERPWSTSASMLEGADGSGVEDGTDPEAESPATDASTRVPGPTDAGESADPVIAAEIEVIAPGSGTAIGNAVHGALQLLGSDPAGQEVTALVHAQCAVHGAAGHEAHVAALVAGALAHPLWAQASAAPRRWHEVYVGAPAVDAADQVRDGIIDLLIEEADGSLMIVDYKTDHVQRAGGSPDPALAARTAHYAPQLREYARLLQLVTGRPVSRCVLLFLAEDGARAREVPVPGA